MKKFTILLSSIALFCTQAMAQPANDEISGAIPLSLGSGSCATPLSGTNVAATNSGVAHTCASYAGGDVWYYVIVPAGGAFNVETSTNGGFTDGGMQAYSGPSSALVSIDCDDDDSPSGLMPAIYTADGLTGLTPGDTIWFAVWEYGNNATGTFEICAWEPPGAPANDEISGAIEIPLGAGSCTGPLTGDNTSATNSGVAHTCASYNGGDVWYYVIVPASGTFIVETSTNGGFTDGGMQAYSGPSSALVIIDCDDDDSPSGLMPAIYPADGLTGLTPGDTIWFAVWEYGNNAFGTFEICGWEPPNPPANDDIAGAIEIPLGVGSCTGPIVGDNTSATNSGVAHTCASYNGGDVWYYAIVPPGGTFTVETYTNGGFTDGGMQAYSGPSSALVSIDCDDDDSPSGLMPAIYPADGLVGLTPGDTIWFAVWEYGNNALGTFEICGWRPASDDIGVVEITTTPSGCGLGMETVSVTVENFGIASQSNFDVVYELNGTPVTPETVTGTVNPGDSITYVFTAMANMSTVGQYTINAWTELGADSDNSNDTLNGLMVEHVGTSLSYFGNAPISSTITEGTNTIVCTNGLVNNLLDSCYMLSAVVLDSIPHTWETDLDIYLISPAGDTLELSTDNGTGSGSDGYMNVTFTDTASTNIAGQTAIDGGFFQPEELAGLAKFNGTDPNGAWTLRIIDDTGGDDGAVGAWHLEFTDNNFAVDLGGDTTVCSQNPLTLMAGVTGNHTYSWSTGETTDQITVDTTSLGGNGVYNIYVTVTDTITGCASVDTIEVTYAICSGIDAVQNNVNVNIAPNPNNGQFVLNVNTRDVSNMTISVVNLQGQTIYAKTNFDNISQVIEPIDLSAQANGIYFVVITTDKGISTHRVVKQ